MSTQELRKGVVIEIKKREVLIKLIAVTHRSDNSLKQLSKPFYILKSRELEIRNSKKYGTGIALSLEKRDCGIGNIRKK